MKRRNFIKHGMLFSSAMALKPGLFAAREKNTRQVPQIKHFIFVNLIGAPSQFELFDPKPDSVNSGGTKTIKTKIPGVIYAEYLTNFANISDKTAILRMTSQDRANHGPARKKLLHAGFNVTKASNRPAMGSLASYAISEAGNGLPTFIDIGGKEQLSGGFLGKKYDSFSNTDSSMFNVPDSIMEEIENGDKIRKLLQMHSPYSSHDAFLEEKKNSEKALKLLKDGKEIFSKSFDDYSTEDKFKLSGLLAHIGFSSIQINIDGWDTHSNNFTSHETKGTAIDKGIGGLVSFLKEHDKFKETLILISGEFGRTPKVAAHRNGRDDYALSYCAAMISGAFKKGMVFGESCKDGITVNNGITVEQMSYTALSMLGTPATVRDNDGINQLLPKGGGIKGFHLR